MGVPTPGFEAAYDVPLTAGDPGLVGFVLETFSGTGAAWFGGSRCSVFLVDSFHVLQNVVVPTGAGSGRSRGLSVAPQPSTADLLAEVAAAQRDEVAFPSPADPGKGWGSKVVVRYLPGGVPYVADYLPHPATATKRKPTLQARTTSAETAGANALLYLSADSDEVPDELSDADAVRVPNPPAPISRAAEGAADAWRDSYRQGYLDGAAIAWDTGETSDPVGLLPDAGVDPLATARDGGYRAGWAAGQAAGLAQRAAVPPTLPLSVSNPVSLVDETLTDPADSGDTDHTAAVPTGDDVVWEHEGNRLLMREGGGFTLDTRNAGKIDFQAAADGVRISSGASVMNVTPAGVTFANGGAAAQETIRGTRLVEWLQTEASFQTAMGPSGPLAAPAPADLKTDKVKVT